MSSLIGLIIDADYEKAVSFFSDDIWLSEYKFMIKQSQLGEAFSDWNEENKNIKDSDEIIKSVKKLDKEKYFSDNFTLYDVDYLAVDFKMNPVFPGNSYSLSFILIIQQFGNSGDYKIVGIDQI